MTTRLLTVPDISCEHCERTIMGALTPVDGISAVQVNIPKHQVTVAFDEAKIGLERIKGILREEEYPVTEVA
ncbi:MAG TPA: heavy-metal-associated domain-containing protein [Actinomycetota bacterium]|nr:heavy-metal-associated domain-containing protein [Actinomycetota bacterium]